MDLFADSMILKCANRLVLLIREMYSYSYLSAFFGKIGAALKAWLFSSVLFNFAERDGFFAKALKFSSLYNFVLKVAVFPLVFLRKRFRHHEELLDGSIIIKALKAILQKFNLILALTVLIFMIIPYAKWHNSYAIAMAVTLLILFFLKAVMIRSVNFSVESFDFYFILFTGSILLSLIFSLFPVEGLRFAVFYFNCFVFILLMVSSIKSTKELNFFLEVLLIGVTLTGIYGMWQGVHGVPVILAQVDTNVNSGLPGRIYSTMGNANDYAEILVMFLPFYFAVILNSKGFLKKLIFLALAMPPVISLFLTQSRSSWIGFALAVLIIVAFKNWKLIPLFILAGLFLVPFLPKTIYMRIMTIFNPNDSSVGFRSQIYQTVQPMLGDYWATGVGLGSDAFRGIVKNYYLYTKGQVPVHCHNLLLQTWLETGIIGVLSFVAFLTGLVKRSMKGIFGDCDKQIKNILIAGIAALLGIMLISMAEYVWFNQRVMLLFWIMLGISMTALNIVRKSKKPSAIKES